MVLQNKRTTIIVILAFLAFAGSAFIFASHTISEDTFSSYTESIGITSSGNADTPVKKSNDLLLAITPHHLVAKPLMDELFSRIGGEEYERVVLISPNHFKKGKAYIQTSDASFTTPAGSLAPDLAFINALVKNNIANIEGESFNGEHGINNIMPYIRQRFPNARLAPILVGEQIEEEKITAFIQSIKNDTDTRTAIILSADFSHYLTSPAAQFHDNFAKSILEGKVAEQAGRVDIDCPSGLKVILQLAKDNRLPFALVGNANSALLTKDNFVKEPTSYITGYYASDNKRSDIGPEMSLMFFGDLMLDRDVRRSVEKKGIDKFFVNSERMFLGSDSNIANLEGPVADNPSVSLGAKQESPQHFQFVFSPQTMPYFKQKGFNAFTIGNNHILNFGKAGLDETKKNLDLNKIQFFGSPAEADNHTIYDNGQVKVGLFSYNQFKTNDEDAILRQVTELRKKVDLLIVYPHWGEEYERKPNQRQTALAHRFIDGGADAVIGSHPHVTQSVEQYKGKYIFYSLGNFVFDQFFSRETMEGLGVGMDYDKEQKRISYYLLPIKMQPSMQVQVLWSEDMRRSLQELADLSMLDAAGKEQVKKGIIE